MQHPFLLAGLLEAAVVAVFLGATVLSGLAHGVNLLMGENAQAVALQLVYATVIYGFGSAAIVIYTETIWPIVVIHFLVDLCSWMQAGTSFKTTGVTFGDVLTTVTGSILANSRQLVTLKD